MIIKFDLLTVNQRILGSSPRWLLLKIEHLHIQLCRCFFFYARFTPCFEEIKLAQSEKFSLYLNEIIGFNLTENVV